MVIGMEFSDVITKRYSVRGYLDKNVEDEKLQYVLKAATIAPTGVNAQPFKVYVIDTKNQPNTEYRNVYYLYLKAKVYRRVI